MFRQWGCNEVGERRAFLTVKAETNGTKASQTNTDVQIVSGMSARAADGFGTSLSVSHSASRYSGNMLFFPPLTIGPVPNIARFMEFDQSCFAPRVYFS